MTASSPALRGRPPGWPPEPAPGGAAGYPAPAPPEIPIVVRERA